MDEELEYRSALFGKWGLAKRVTPGGPGTLDPDRHPVSAGYDLFQGVPFCCFGPEEDYIDWFKSFAKFDPTSGCDRNIFSWHYDPDCVDWGAGPPNATPTTSDDYATAVNVADARAWLADPSVGEPWFLVVSFNAAHSPYHHPSHPSGSCSDPSLCYREMTWESS